MSARAPATRTSASDRVARLLAMIPWIAANDGPTLDEVCERFGVSRAKLTEDLDVIEYVGVPPYTPDTLIEVTLEGDRVWMRFADVFARPLRLTPEQGLALVAAGAASQGLPGSDRRDPWPGAGEAGGCAGRRSRRGRRRSTWGRPGRACSTRCARPSPSGGACASTTTPTGVTSAARGPSIRTPSSPTTGRGTCTATATRPRPHARSGSTASVDVDVLDETFEPPAAGAKEPSFALGPEIPRVTLELGPAARWVAETYPMDEVAEADGGWLRVRMAVTATPWLERLLVRLGDGVRVVTADDPAHETAGRDAAQRILARYRAG